MRNFLGGGFYLAAAVYLAATKPLDLITAVAIAAGLVMAGLAVTKYTDWAAISGGLLIAGSLFLQSLLSYRCLDCIRADILIMAGVITLSIMEQGRYKLMLRALSSVIAVFMAFNIAVHYNPSVVFGMEPAKVIVAQTEDVTEAECPDKSRPDQIVPGQEASEKQGQISPVPALGENERGGVDVKEQHPSPSTVNSTGAAKKEPDRYVQAVAMDGRFVALDTTVKPVLFFSPTCGACLRAVEALVKADPEGKRWVPVQSYGDPQKGRELLKEKGYRGESYVYANKWRGSVPAMVGYNINGIYKTNSQDEMLRIIRGDAS